jgi:hypothetical protein
MISPLSLRSSLCVISRAMRACVLHVLRDRQRRSHDEYPVRNVWFRPRLIRRKPGVLSLAGRSSSASVNMPALSRVSAITSLSFSALTWLGVLVLYASTLTEPGIVLVVALASAAFLLGRCSPS